MVLDALASHGSPALVVKYQGPDGRFYGFITGFKAHQRPFYREPASVLPAPPEGILGPKKGGGQDVGGGDGGGKLSTDSSEDVDDCADNEAEEVEVKPQSSDGNTDATQCQHRRYTDSTQTQHCRNRLGAGSREDNGYSRSCQTIYGLSCPPVDNPVDNSERNRLLSIRWPMREYKGLTVLELPADYAGHMYAKLMGGGGDPELIEALRLRVKLKLDEMSDAQRKTRRMPS